jgi:L-ascorbate metabolism protein UlaG (beta-lactamase superfamily)
MDTQITYLGGATYLIEIGPFRLLTDPGFDPEGTEKSEGPGHVLTKIMAPPVAPEALGRIDAVLLSHQQHYDNLDTSGRALLPSAGRVLTTPESAAALGDYAEGLAPGEHVTLKHDAGETVRVTATLALHGLSPEVRQATGDVTGFVLEWDGARALYVTGDTVWFDEIVEVGRRFDVGAVVLHMGAAKVPAAGDNALTMTSEEGARLTAALDTDVAFAAHFEGWAHYTDSSRERMQEVFDAAGIGDRLHLIAPGESVRLESNLAASA